MSLRNTNSAFFHRWLGIAALVPIIASGLLLANCGGGGGSSAGGTGRFVLTVKWPEPSNSRLVPTASNSIKAVLTRGESTLGQTLLVRPSQPPWTTTVTFDDLAAGTVTLTATAFPQADGTGVAQASGLAPATIVGGQTAQVTVTMASTIDHLVITPANPTISVAAQQQLTMTAYDAQNNVVLVAPANVSWQSASQDKATVNATGLATGVAAGTSLVTVRESESNKSASTTVTVNSSGGCVPGPVTGPGGLASGAPWPKQYHDVRNSSLGAGSGATGEVKWTTTVTGPFGLLTSAPSVGADGTVYVISPGSQGPALYALNPADGTIKWQSVLLSDTKWAPMLGANGLIYVVGSGLTALDGQNGAVRWTYSQPASPPTVGPDGRIYTFARVNNQPEIVALDGATGAVKWERAVSEFAARLLVGADGTVYAAGGDDDDVVALDGNCGTVKWRFSNSPRGATGGVPAVGPDGTIYYQSAFSSPTVRAELVAVDPVSGAKKWAVDVPSGGAFVGLAVGANGTIYGTANDGRLMAISPTGTVQWTFTPQGQNPDCLEPPSIGGDGTIYYGVFAASGGPGLNTVYAVNPNGTQKWAVPSPTFNVDSASIAIGADGTLYLSSQYTGKVAAIK